MSADASVRGCMQLHRQLQVVEYRVSSISNVVRFARNFDKQDGKNE